MDHGNQALKDQDTATSGGDGSSVFEDVAALLDDGRTLVEAELAFQKTRLSYAGQRGRNVAIFAIAAFMLVTLAIFGAVVGAILALTPSLGAVGATAVVVGVLIVIAGICALAAAQNARMIAKAFRKDD